MQPSLDKHELRQRIALVRAAKNAKARLGRGRDLSPEELIAVLPPERRRVKGPNGWQWRMA